MTGTLALSNTSFLELSNEELYAIDGGESIFGVIKDTVVSAVTHGVAFAEYGSTLGPEGTVGGAVVGVIYGAGAGAAWHYFWNAIGF